MTKKTKLATRYVVLLRFFSENQIWIRPPRTTQTTVFCAKVKYHYYISKHKRCLFQSGPTRANTARANTIYILLSDKYYISRHKMCLSQSGPTRANTHKPVNDRGT